MSMLTERSLPAEGNDTETPFRRESSLSQGFDEQVERTPEAIAIASNEGEETFRQVRERVDAVARSLRERGIAAGELVGLWSRRSPDTIVGLLGILKSGGAYVPIPVDAPAARVRTILADAKIAQVVSCDPLDGSEGFEAESILLVRDAVLTHDNRSDERAYPDAEDLACVIYTSGSTGVPKGVCVAHRSFVNLMAYRLGTQFQEGDFAVTPLTAPLHFDPSLIQLLSPFLSGGTLVVLPTLAELAESPWYDRLTVLTGLPSLILEVTARYGFPKAARVVSLGAEPIPRALLDAIAASGTVERLWTTYGVTECACYSTAALVYDRHEDGLCEPAIARLRTIGRPIANTQIHLLDEERRPVPSGTAGELYIGGEGLARGYLNRPDLTQGRFVPNPFIAGERLYRTGDLGRRGPDGALEFLGRLDGQVKLRGHRIELFEIETALAEHPRVAQCVVVLRKEGEDGGRLVAYFVPRPGASVGAAPLREHLSARLPEPMLPAAFVPLERLPVTSTGKLDRRALPAPASGHLASGREHVAPRSLIESGLAEIWRVCLGVERIGLHDDFFELGGHSLVALRLVAAIESRFGRRLSPEDLYRGPTIAALARRIEEPGSSGPLAVVPIRPGGTNEPLFVVHSLTGGLLFWQKFLSGLDPQQPVLGLGLPDDREALAQVGDLETLAAWHVERLIAARPEGAFRLAGYSAGGVLAFEIARQLEERGRRVAFLGVIDAQLNGCKRSRGHQPRFVPGFFANLPYWLLDHVWHTTSARRGERFRTALVKIRRRVAGTKRTAAEGGSQELDAPAPLREASNQYERLVVQYLPRPYGGTLTLLRTRARPLLEFDRFDYGWNEFAARVDVKIAAHCHHNAMVDEPQVRGVAQALQSALDATP